MTTAQHTSNSSDWHTPDWLVQASRKVLGGKIDYDPYSSQEANVRILAECWDGPSRENNRPTVHHNVFCNPPSRMHKQAFRDIIENPFLIDAIYIIFNIQQLQVNQELLNYPMCIPSKRVSYVAGQGVIQYWKNKLLETEDPKTRESLQKKIVKGAESPPHASAILYIPNTRDNSTGFKNLFETFGKVINVP